MIRITIRNHSDEVNKIITVQESGTKRTVDIEPNSECGFDIKDGNSFTVNEKIETITKTKTK